MTSTEKSEKDNNQSKRKSGSAVNDRPGSLLAVVRFREALDRTEMPATAQKIGGFIVRKFNVEEGYAWPTIARIAFECSCSEATVYRAFQEKDGPLREWFKVGKTVINGEERNTYTPDWVKADAANREFEIRLKEWQKDHAETSQNERLRPRKMRGDDLAKCETIEVRAQNLSDRASFRTRSGERVKHRFGPSGLAGDDDLRQFIAELHTILPDHEPFDEDDRKPFNAERSRQGELPQLWKLNKAGWTKDEVREMVETYVQSARNDAVKFDPTFKTLSSIFAELLHKTRDQNRFEGDEEFYGRRLPERFLRKLEESADSPIVGQSAATEKLDAEPPEDDDEGRWIFSPDDIARHTAEQI